PVLSRHARLVYDDYPDNLKLVDSHFERLKAAVGLVICTPIWNFGLPAILKGYFYRVWMPGVSYELVNGKVESRLRHIRKL
ncbi:NAD(P)H-dependent oxidoreductase, partial [Rhizobium johnstonii]|uniref:NAD(P)H-dependent oxidoreductase n=1 Tax=Rhizobium johnstonii TaxID=3019933 RepID=UPI003F9D5F63